MSANNNIKSNNIVITSTHDVVIIGGGLSGLTCATELLRLARSHDNECNVLILEAQERVGGRLHTLVVDEKNVDVGGQWVGPSQLNILNLLKQLNIETYKQHFDGQSLVFSGTHPDKVISKRYSGIIPPLGWLALIDLQLAIWDCEKKSKTIPLDKPWDFPEARQYDSMTVQSYMDQKMWTQEAKDSFSTMVEVVFAADAAEVSFLFFLYYIQTAGGVTALIETVNGAQDSKIRGGAQSVPIALAKNLGESRIRLNSPVVKIDQSFEKSDHVLVTTRNGEVFACKKVIMAIPPTLTTRVQFAPPVPGIRDQLCQRMPLAYVIKTTVLFKSTWWRDKGYSGFFANTTGLVEDYPVRAGYDFTEHPGIVGFILGHRARYWGQKNEEDRKEAVLKQYATMFGTSIDVVKSEMTHYVEKDWAQQEFNRGAYESFTTPGALTSCGWALREPIQHVHFAGTETATEWTGYMDGAVQAGVRAAKEVVELLSQEFIQQP